MAPTSGKINSDFPHAMRVVSLYAAQAPLACGVNVPKTFRFVGAPDFFKRMKRFPQNVMRCFPGNNGDSHLRIFIGCNRRLRGEMLDLIDGNVYFFRFGKSHI